MNRVATAEASRGGTGARQVSDTSWRPLSFRNIAKYPVPTKPVTAILAQKQAIFPTPSVIASRLKSKSTTGGGSIHKFGLVFKRDKTS